MRGSVWGGRVWVALFVFGLLSTTTPASAATVGTATFVATITTGAPLDWPCVTMSKLCPVFFPGLVGIQTGPKGEPDVEVHPGGNRVFASLVSDACVLATANVGEAKSPVEAGACDLQAQGFVHGFCGLFETQLIGSLDGSQSMPVLVELTDVGGVVVLTGVVGKAGDLGNLHGVGTLVAVPEPGVPPGNNCLAKTATRFTLAATVALKILD